MKEQHVESVLEKDVIQLAEDAKIWVASLEGQKAIQESLRKADALASQLREARNIDPKTLHEPVTV